MLRVLFGGERQTLHCNFVRPPPMLEYKLLITIRNPDENDDGADGDDDDDEDDGEDTDEEED